MTKLRRDGGGTAFGNLLRTVPELDSKLGFAATDVDLMWCDYSHNRFLLLETKEYMARMPWSQRQLLGRLNKALIHSPEYYGWHLLQFQRTSWLDGDVSLDGKDITTEDLMDFLSFRKEMEWYSSYAK